MDKSPANKWKQLPKVDLHRHLELCIDLDTFMRLAPKVGISDLTSKQEVLKKYFVTQPMKNLESVLHCFLTMQKFWSSIDLIEELTFIACQNALSEGIELVEFRYAPTFLGGAAPHLNFIDMHSAVMKGVQRGQKLGLKVGVIGIIQRTLPYKKAEEVMEFFIDNKETFCGVDLADTEVGFDCKPFSPLFLKAKKAGMGITIHSGEENVPQAPQFVMDAIQHLGAERIGHGLQIIHSKKVMEFVKQEGVVLELCPTSNWLTNAVTDLKIHPIRKLFDFGIKTTINTDDPGIFDIDLNHEYNLLHELHGFTKKEFLECLAYSAQASFIS